MQLYSVISAKEITQPGRLELVIDAEIGGVRDHYPYGFDPDDPYGLAPAIKAYLDEHPITPDPYTPPSE